MLSQSATVSNSVNHFIKMREIGKLDDLAIIFIQMAAKIKVVILQESGDLVFNRHIGLKYYRIAEFGLDEFPADCILFNQMQLYNLYVS